MAERPLLPLQPLPEGAEAGGPPPPRLPGTLSSLRPPLLNVLLFVLTALSAFYMGSELIDTALPKPTDTQKLWNGLTFSTSLVAILLSHEMGHFLLARRHRVDATWPFFIPAPLLSIIGTLGAVMKLRSLPRTRRALIDIGVAGPIAGFVVTIPVLAWGISLSPMVPVEEGLRHWTLARAIESALTTGKWLAIKDGFDLGYPLAMQLVQDLVVGPLPAGQTLALHPVAIAGWFGLLLTALNLLPLGQLDGGHLVFGASPRVHAAIGPPISGLLVGLGIFTPFTGWLLWGLATGLLLNGHPRLADPEPRLDGARRFWIWAAVAVFLLCFTPAPILPLAAG